MAGQFQPRVTRHRKIARTPGIASALVLAAVAALSVAACDATPDYLRRDAQERRLAEVGMETVDPTGTSADAGMSLMRKIRVTPLDLRKLGGDTLSAGFHRLRHRCGTCHEAPDPGSHTAIEWAQVIPKMEKHMEDAGLIPLNGVERQYVLDYLRRHAAAW